MRSVIFAVSTALTVLLSACTGAASSVPVNTVSSVSASTSITTSSEVDSAVSESASSETGNIQTGLVREQTLDSAEGLIHYSYYLPEDYDPTRKSPMMVVMPGYNMMWFGESSSGSNLDWTGFTSWTNLGQDMIVVSAQLTDWGDTSARQAIALTEYFINHFAVDTARIYAAGYSAGGETMSRAVAMRPDLYAAYLHGASQWDGGFAPIAENGVAVYIYMAQGDTTVCRKHGMPTTVCTMLTPPQAGRMNKSTPCCKCRPRTTPFSMRRGFTSTMLPQMLSLMMPIF